MNELKVGFLTLLAILSITGVTLKITGDKKSFGKYVTYKTIVEDATGINENATIKVAGIPSGSIKKIELSGSKALITFDVVESIKVTQFSKLRIKSVGFLGDKYLDIYLGTPNADRLEENSMVVSEGGAGFEELGKDASDVLKDVKAIAQNIKEALVDEMNNNVTKQIVENVRKFTENANDIAVSLKRIVNNNEDKLHNSIASLERLTAQLAKETDRAQEGTLMNDLSGLKPILDNVNQASEDLKVIIADLKAGKGTVGKLLRDEEVVDQVSQTLAGVNKIVGRVNNLKTDLSIYSGVNTRFGSRTDFDVDLIPGPERFFRLGVVFSDYGPLQEKKSTTYSSTNGGAEDRLEERKIDDSKLKFNLQIGRRFNRFVLRAGAIESTGGVGADYLMPDYGFRMGLEAFDYQEKAGPNLRAYTEVKLWNVLYTRVLADDTLSKTGNSSFTFSLGLRFSDEDLASLIGLMAL